MLQELLTRIDALRAKVNEAWSMLKLDTMREEIMVLEGEQLSPDFWTDSERATKQSQRLAEVKKEYDVWNGVRMHLLELDELVRMAMEDADTSFVEDVETRLTSLEKQYLVLEFALLFSGDHDDKDAILAVHAGAGGTDAQDWAEMLLRMYFRYAERKGWSVQLVDESRGGEAGIKSATFIVSGRHVYGHLKAEAGVHRLVRQSPFNSDALRQTSFALVEVLPELGEAVDVEIRPEDLRIDTFMSGGKGGQSVNTTYSAVRIVHLPTKITVSCQNERSQMQNKETAMRILKARLQHVKDEELQKEKQQLRGEHQSAEWGSQIRSYVLHPYKMVKDHRTDVETSDPEAVLDGDLDAFVEGYLRWKATSSKEG
ncbi:MAG: peptide chain release factor 2 [Bacteroidota bacterium]